MSHRQIEQKENIKRQYPLPNINSQQTLRLTQLSKQIQQLKINLQQTTKTKNDLKQQIAFLKSQNQTLKIDNEQLKRKIKQLQKLLAKQQRFPEAEIVSVKSLKNMYKHQKASGMSSKYSKPQTIQSATSSMNTELLRQLLVDMSQPSESGFSKNLIKSKNMMTQSKTSTQCFQPWLSALQKDLKIRLKRCLSRQKSQLLKNQQLQIGTICPYQYSQTKTNTFRMILAFTNISNEPFSNIVFQPLFNNQITLTRRGQKQKQKKWRHLGVLMPNEQARLDIQVSINNIDFRCVQLDIQYNNKQIKRQVLVLPLSKCKLFKQVAYTSPPQNGQKIQRVFDFQKKVLSEIQKLKKIYKNCLQVKQRNGTVRYIWKITFLSNLFWIESYLVQDKLAIAVTYLGDRSDAEKVLDQLVFIYQKI